MTPKVQSSAHPPHSYDELAHAAEVLWGTAGRWAVEEQARHNARYFAGGLPPLPVIIGITAYGKCLGATRPRDKVWWRGAVPRITLASNIFAGGAHDRGTRAVSDIVLHEMVHAALMLAGRDPAHNGRPWCDEIMRLTPLLLAGRTIQAAPVHPRRVDGANVRQARAGFLTRKELAAWPYSIRPRGGPAGPVLRVPTY